MLHQMNTTREHAALSSALLVFPTPFPEAWSLVRGEGCDLGRHARRRRRRRLLAELWVNCQLGYITFVTLGSPKAGYTHFVPGGSPDAWHREVARRLLSRARGFCQTGGGDIPTQGRGRARLLQLFRSCDIGYNMTADVGNTVAEDVDETKVKLPKVPGVLRPADVLRGERREVVLDMERLILPVEQQPVRTARACHRISFENEVALARRMVASGQAELVEESSLPRGRDGSLLKGGLFAVPHSKGRQRLILDRRPLNAVEQKLPWCHLPHGSLYKRVVLEPGETIRGSGDDLESYFFLLSHENNWIRRNSFGRRVSGQWAEQLGGESRRSYRLCMKVWAWATSTQPV